MPSRKVARRSRSAKRHSSRSPSPTRHDSKKKHHSKPHANKPKRPLSAYMFFAQKERAGVKSAHPKYKVTEVAKELGKLWRAMHASEKKHFEELSKKDKARYAREMGKSS